jgi:Protein of unknown function (DUF1997)
MGFARLLLTPAVRLLSYLRHMFTCTSLTHLTLGTGQVQGHLDLEVWSEVIGPFRFMPRAFLESTGSAVLGALVRGLLPPFIGR